MVADASPKVVVILALGAVALVFFGAHLRSVLKRLDPPGRMANAAFAGALVAAVGFMVSAGLHGALTDAADQADSRVRPLSRRALRIERPARVLIRARKPCLRARRRVFGW